MNIILNSLVDEKDKPVYRYRSCPLYRNGAKEVDHGGTFDRQGCIGCRCDTRSRTRDSFLIRSRWSNILCYRESYQVKVIGNEPT